MKDQEINPVPLPGKGSDELSPGEITDLKIHRHLSDKDDEISDGDIENVRTDIFETNPEVPGESQSPALTGNGKNDKEGGDPPKENKDENEEKEPDGVPIVTPWSILGS